MSAVNWLTHLEVILINPKDNVTRIISTPPRWDATPSQGYPTAFHLPYPFIRLGGIRQCKSKEPYLVLPKNIAT